MENVTEQLVTFATSYGLKVLGAIAILIIGRMAAGIGRKIVRRVLNNAGTDPSVVSFVGSLIYTLIIILAVVAALAKFGIETASFIAVLGAVGFAIGFALQGSLSNFAAGLLILILRPYKVGDFIEGGGVMGSVKEIKLFTTILATPDNIQILVPNGKIFGEVIKNITAYDTRRLDIVVGIGYGSSIQKAHDVFLQTIKADQRVLSDPAPQVMVTELADSSVNLNGRFWVKKEDYWPVKFDLTRQIKEAYDENGIDIPFPQRVVHMTSSPAA